MMKEFQQVSSSCHAMHALKIKSGPLYCELVTEPPFASTWAFVVCSAPLCLHIHIHTCITYLHMGMCQLTSVCVCCHLLWAVSMQAVKAEIAAREKSVQSVTKAAGQLISSGAPDHASNIQHDVEVLASK